MTLLGDDHDQMCKTKLQIRISRNDTHTAASFNSVALAADFKFSKVLFLGPDSCHRKCQVALSAPLLVQIYIAD